MTQQAVPSPVVYFFYVMIRPTSIDPLVHEVEVEAPSMDVE